MTDLTPNDLSQMSDEDFNALCPQGHHAPGAEPLSPAAQAVVNATDELVSYDFPTEGIAAAALRAAADQVVPKRKEPRFAKEATHADWFARDDVRDDLLAIAAELDPTTGASGEH